jgi:hypothetical protein
MVQLSVRFRLPFVWQGPGSALPRWTSLCRQRHDAGRRVRPTLLRHARACREPPQGTRTKWKYRAPPLWHPRDTTQITVSRERTNQYA